MTDLRPKLMINVCFSIICHDVFFILIPTIIYQLPLACSIRGCHFALPYQSVGKGILWIYDLRALAPNDLTISWGWSPPVLALNLEWYMDIWLKPPIKSWLVVWCYKSQYIIYIKHNLFICIHIYIYIYTYIHTCMNILCVYLYTYIWCLHVHMYIFIQYTYSVFFLKKLRPMNSSCLPRLDAEQLKLMKSLRSCRPPGKLETPRRVRGSRLETHRIYEKNVAFFESTNRKMELFNLWLAEFIKAIVSMMDFPLSHVVCLITKGSVKESCGEPMEFWGFTHK